MSKTTRKTFISGIKEIINQSRRAAIRNVDFQRVLMYWHIGKSIFEEEQHGKERADYGDYLIKNLAKELEPEYGSGFSVRILEISRQFFRIYPIANALRSQLNWLQYACLFVLIILINVSITYLRLLKIIGRGGNWNAKLIQT